MTEQTTEPAPPEGRKGFAWKRWLLILGGVLLLALLVIQVIPYGRDHTNPPATAAPAWDSPRTEQLFADACGDCHSNLTTWPWYSNIAPFSWLIQHDVDEGRSKLNLSELDRTEIEVGEIEEMIREGEMPPWQFKLLHAGARLSDQEKEDLISGLEASLAGTASADGAAGDGGDSENDD